jgi:hypothetical protein
VVLLLEDKVGMVTLHEALAQLRHLPLKLVGLQQLVRQRGEGEIEKVGDARGFLTLGLGAWTRMSAGC